MIENEKKLNKIININILQVSTSWLSSNYKDECIGNLLVKSQFG